MNGVVHRIIALPMVLALLIALNPIQVQAENVGGVNLGNLTNYLFFFANGSSDANWQGASKGFVGDVAVDGIQAKERTSGTVPFAGKIYTNDTTLGAWQNIVDANSGQASGMTDQTARISGLEADLISAFQQTNALTATPGYSSVSSASLNGLNTQNGKDETFIINVTSGLNFSSQINITGDGGDVFILRWDTDGNPINGYQGVVKPQSGGAIVPHGGLTPSNFINVAGDIQSSGGGSTPGTPYPQGPRYDGGQGALIDGGSDFSGGGFFTGYWLTTGKPDSYDADTGLYYGATQSLSNGIFVGGWYTITTKFSITSGTSGVYVSPRGAHPSIDVEKYVSVDYGTTWLDADTAATAPEKLVTNNLKYKFVVTNTGDVPLANITLSDFHEGTYYDLSGITIIDPLPAGGTFEGTIGWDYHIQALEGLHTDTATATGDYGGVTYVDTDDANYIGNYTAPY